MTAPTHITFAEFVYLLILTTTGIPLSLTNAVIVGASALVPDIDTAASTLGSMLPFISTRIERRYGHRTLTHSLLFIAGLGVCLLPLLALNRPAYACFLAGYASHPFIDTMTVNGVKLFYPFSTAKCVFPLEVNNPGRYRIRTGSRMDKALGLIFLLGCIPTLLISSSGYERFVRAARRNIDAAVRDYNDFSVGHRVLADVEVHNALTKQPLSGRVEVIGALNRSTLVFRGPEDGLLHTLGKEFQADYVVESILCTKGEEARSSIRIVDLSNQFLSSLSALVDSGAQGYFFGDLETSDKVSLPENIRMFTPVTGGGNLIRLNFADLGDIGAYHLENAFITKGILTIKSISAGPSVRGAEHELPKPDAIVRMSVPINAADSLTLLKKRGEPVREGELLALRNPATMSGDLIDLDSQKIAGLKQQASAITADLDLKIANAGQAARIDSVDYEHDRELSGGNFVAAPVLDASRLRWNKDRQLLRGLLASRSLHMLETGLEIGRLRSHIAALKAKQASARILSEIRSTASGVLVDIRRIQSSGKSTLTFILRKIR